MAQRVTGPCFCFVFFHNLRARAIFHETKDGSACKVATASFFGVTRGCGQTLLRRYLVSSSGGSFTCSRFEIRFVSVSHSVTRNLVHHESSILFAEAFVLDWRRTHGSPVSAFVLYERRIWFHSTTNFSRRLRCLTNSMWINFRVLLHQLKIRH